MYRGSGYLPVCNDCVEDMYEQYRDSLGDDKEAMRRMCMKLDLYWNEDIYNMVERTVGVNSRIRNYIGKTNLIRYIDKTFDDTIAEGNALDCQRSGAIYQEHPQALDEIEETPVDQKIVDFWGAGFTSDFYVELERRYQDWTNGVPVVEPSERSLYKQICILEATISRDSAQGKAIDKNVNALNTLLGSMNLKPAQKKRRRRCGGRWDAVRRVDSEVGKHKAHSRTRPGAEGCGRNCPLHHGLVPGSPLQNAWHQEYILQAV